ncbi:unnamed protein product [Arabidopsis halleri]
MGNPSRPNEVVVLWDSNQLRVDDWYDISTLRVDLNDLVKTVNPEFNICTHGNVVCGDIDDCFTPRQKSDLRANGFIRYQAPDRKHFCTRCKWEVGVNTFTVKAERAPELVLRCLMLGGAIQQNLPQNILLMTGDRNFKKTMWYLRQAGYTVFLVKCERSGDFEGEYTRAWTWEVDL